MASYRSVTPVGPSKRCLAYYTSFAGVSGRGPWLFFTGCRPCQSFWEFRVFVDASLIDLALGESLDLPKISPSEISLPELGFLEISSSEIGSLEISLLEVRVPEISPSEISILEVGTPENGLLEIGSLWKTSRYCGPVCSYIKIRRIGPDPSELGVLQAGLLQLGLLEVGPKKVGLLEIG